MYRRVRTTLLQCIMGAVAAAVSGDGADSEEYAHLGGAAHAAAQAGRARGSACSRGPKGARRFALRAPSLEHSMLRRAVLGEDRRASLRRRAKLHQHQLFMVTEFFSTAVL